MGFIETKGLDEADLVGDVDGLAVRGEADVSLLGAIGPARGGEAQGRENKNR
jgi:hypothetical protein